MWRVLLVISLVPVVLAIAARWWWALRVYALEGRRECRCQATRWPELAGGDGKSPAPPPPPAAASAREFGGLLRERALAAWRVRDKVGWSKREAARRFGQAVPPLSAMVAVFAVMMARIPVTGGLAVVAAAMALGAFFSMVSLGAELRAVGAAARALRASRCFPRRDDEDAVISCATAEAWDMAVPPMIRWIQPKPRGVVRRTKRPA